MNDHRPRFRRTLRRLGLAVPFALLALTGPGCASSADAPPLPAGGQTLHDHVVPAAQKLAPIGRLAADRRLSVTIGLPLRDADGLNQLLEDLYNPDSDRYRQYLTPQEFAAAYGPAESDYDTLVTFAKARGLNVVTTYDDRTLLEVEGSVADLEAAFHTVLLEYQHPSEPRTFFAPQVEPSLDVAVQVLHVSGLDDFALPHSAMKHLPPPGSAPTPAQGGGTQGWYNANDLRAAYAGDTGLTGAGQIVGIYNPDHNFRPTDITAYEDNAGLAHVPVEQHLLDGAGTQGVVDGFSGEVTLDIEMAIAMAPGLAKVIVYQSNDGLKALKQMATDNVAKQLSTSWVGSGADPNWHAVYVQFAAQGQSFFSAAGDDGAYYPTVPQSVDDPYVTVVGGTELSTSGPRGAWTGEACWTGSGGGYMGHYAIPTWQQGMNLAAQYGSNTYRNSPDVSAVADNVQYFNNGAQWTGGTSAASPIWAGFAALVNQQAANVRQPPVGQVNSAMYAIGRSTLYGSSFHDVTTGNNLTGWNTTPNHLHQYYAQSGFDMCSGWGSPKGQQLIEALAGKAITTTHAPAVATTPDGVLFFATAPDGRIYDSRVVLGGAAQRWKELEGGGRTDAAPAAALCGNSPYTFVAVKGLDQNVYINQGGLGGPYVGWRTDYQIKTNVAPAVAKTPDGVMFFATDTSGRILENRVVLGQAGQGWKELDGGGRTDASPAAALCGNSPYVFAAVKGLDDYVYINQGGLGGPYVGWRTDWAIQTNVAPAVATTPDGVIFFVKDLQGRIFSNRVVLGQAGQGWRLMEGGGLTDAAPAAALSGNYPYVFALAKGLDDGVYVNQGTLGSPFIGWQRL
jgi:hypothetical protein